jgi:hypothetical protein
MDSISFGFFAEDNGDHYLEAVDHFEEGAVKWLVIFPS